MAYKKFSSLTSRNQSSLVTQIHKLINYYGGIFVPRERSYLKKLSNTSDSIYWLEDDERKLIAVSIIDPNYTFNVDGIELHTLGHTIAKRPGQMERIFNHIWSDYEEKSILLLCRQTLASVLELKELGLIPFKPTDLLIKWKNLATLNTDYFNMSDEDLYTGMERKQYGLYLKLTPQDQQKLQATNPDLIQYISNYSYETVSI